ncbi:MAG: uracil-DNA glycosylase family protein [Gammaproteobacteria bacterium]|nr:uracil-DNA glycosylase family protein [Gammaproteobacteria bacterium]
MDDPLITACRHLAATLQGIDHACYQNFQQDPLAPIFSANPHAQSNAKVAIFGRDPGSEEVRLQRPFVGAAGIKLRSTLYHHQQQRPHQHFSELLTLDADYFWINTVPYKPLGNKAWSMAVKKQFQPLVITLLLQRWQGNQVITLGREAFFWFTINQSAASKTQLTAFWQREDRFSRSVTITLEGGKGGQRTVTLYPLPHPSPLNAKWYKRFPELLTARLQQLNPNNLEIEVKGKGAKPHELNK